MIEFTAWVDNYKGCDWNVEINKWRYDYCSILFSNGYYENQRIVG